MLRGNFSARIDNKGRLKIPTAFRAPIEETYGSALFVTSIIGESVRIYPMPVWIGIEEKLALRTLDPSFSQSVPRPGQFLRSASRVR